MLETENIPLLRRITSIPTGGVTPFHCKIPLINLKYDKKQLH